jgi:hypothetical protein
MVAKVMKKPTEKFTKKLTEKMRVGYSMAGQASEERATL